MLNTIINFFRVQKVLKKIYDDEKIDANLSRILGVECKRDWVGRLYMVVNPIVQNMETDGNVVVYDIDNNIIVEAWIMKNLNLIRRFIVNNSLFDILTYSIKKIDDDENYLVVFKNIYFDDFIRICKWVGGGLILGLLIGIIFLIF